MSRNFFAATERRAVINTLKAAVFVVAFMFASLLSSSTVLANTTVKYGWSNINSNGITETKIIEESIQNAQPIALQAITLGEIDFAPPRSAYFLVVFKNSDQLSTRFVGQTNQLERKVPLASLAQNYVIDLVGSNAMTWRPILLNSKIHNIVLRHLDMSPPKVNVNPLLAVPNSVLESNSLQQPKTSEIISANLEAEEVNRIWLLAEPQRLPQLSTLSLI